MAEIVAFNRHVEVVDRDADGAVRAHYVIASFVARWISGEGMTTPEASALEWRDPADIDDLATTRELGDVLASAARIARAPR